VIVHSKTKLQITDAIREHLVDEKFNTPGERGEMQRQRAWKFFLQYPLRVSSADFVAVSPTN
jgi:hypothetical protein